jgi:hypothetical protein
VGGDYFLRRTLVAAHGPPAAGAIAEAAIINLARAAIVELEHV